MAPPPRSEREAERRHNIRTLVIASAASATAAAAVSQLWIAGTWIAAAVTPVLVALVSELLNRPADRIARAWTDERPALPGDAPAPRPSEPAPPPRTAPPSAPGEAPVRIYRQPPPPRQPGRRKLAIGAVLATGLLAFAIAAVTLTVGELLAGGSIGKSDRRTTFVGGRSDQEDKKQPADEGQTDTTEQQRTETTQQAPARQRTETTPAPTETTETTPTPAPQTAPETAPPTETAP